MSQPQPSLPVFSGPRFRSWPKCEHGGAPDYVSLGKALTNTYETDAHFAGYSVPSIARRLGVAALKDGEAGTRLAAGVSMVLVLFDVDCAAAHGGDPSAVDAWWLAQLPKIEMLLDRHPGGYVYRTRGGYRLVYVLQEPITLADVKDAEEWSSRYCAWITYLRRAFGIEADSACKDWTRLFRLPRATRDPSHGAEQRETLGDPNAIGAWDCALEPSDIEAGRKLAPKRRRRKRRAEDAPTPAVVGEGLFWHLLRARDLVGQSIEPGKYAVACPNEAAHSMGTTFDGSTVLFAPAPGEALGWLHCSHAHCQDRTARDTLAAFDDEEIAAAREAAGLHPSPALRAGSASEAPPTATWPKVYVPGSHKDETGEYFEVSTHDFAKVILGLLEPGSIYRKDSVVGHVLGLPGHRRFTELGEHAMRRLIDSRARLVRGIIDRETQAPTVVYRPCTRDLAALVLSAASASLGVRELQLLVHHPVYGPDLELAAPGWNEKGGIYYDEPDDLRALVPRREGAWAVLEDLVIDFPFKDEASRQNYFGVLLTQITRSAIQGPVPFGMLLASLERTGKGKLIDTGAGVAITGETVPLIQLGGREEEREKRITSLLIAGTTIVHFDNIPGGEVMDSASLASLATAYPRWQGRLLGKSSIVTIPNRAVVVLSGNNVRATGELCKRTVPIALESPTPHPELREDYVHPDNLAHAAAKRRDVMEALLGLVEDWKAQGRPESKVRMGGFERWVEIVGGVMKAGGATSWMTNYAQWIATADDESSDATVLVEAWAREHGESAVSATQILELVKKTGTFSRVLVSPTEEGRRVSLGRRVLSLLADRPVGGWIVRRTGSGSSSLYHLVRGMA